MLMGYVAGWLGVYKRKPLPTFQPFPVKFSFPQAHRFPIPGNSLIFEVCVCVCGALVERERERVGYKLVCSLIHWFVLKL